MLVILFTAWKGMAAQEGKIIGKVMDAKTGETLPGASVLIEGTSMGAATDFDGNYAISHLKAGTYNILCRYVSYADKRFVGITLKENEVLTLNISLAEPVGDTLATVTVTATINKENNNALLMMQKNNPSVSDGISAELIKKTPDRNTSDILKRVSGAAIQDNKFVIVRGLNERYNAAYINGAPLPSTESDRKAFSFDLFPAVMLDNLVISKTASPDLPAEFAGGVIQVNTKSIPDKNFYSFSVGTGYNTITTGKQRIYTKGGKYDWTGIDDGSRNLPASLPSVNDFPQLASDQAQLAKGMKNDWALFSKNFAPNSSFQFSMGRNMELGKSQLGVLLALTQNSSYTYNETERRSYASNMDENVPTQLETAYTDKAYAAQHLSGLLANISFKLNENHQIELKNLGSANADDRVTVRTGTPTPLEENPTLLKSTERFYKAGRIHSSQICGTHYIPLLKLRTNWTASYTGVRSTIPNRKISRYLRLTQVADINDPIATDTMYAAAIDQSSVGPDYGGFMFSALTEEAMKSAKADVARSVEVKQWKWKAEIKAGILAQIRERTFAARQLGYQKHSSVGGTLQFNQQLLYLPEDQIFDSNNMGQLGTNIGGFKLKDGTKPNDSYTAYSELNAAYLMLDNRIMDKLRITGGCRMEQFNQRLHAQNLDKSVVDINTVLADFLPSVNLTFALTEQQNIRLAYSHTVNRPEFRELAPFAFYDYATQFVVSGNPDLKRALIKNYDLRYEIYPGRGQILSASTFYKDFTNPIEMKSRVDVTSEITYINVSRAMSYGAEAEFRIIPGVALGMDSSLFLNNITLFANYTYIKSKVNAEDIIGATMKERPMQGQSPYIINTGILYYDSKSGFSANVALNRSGSRIYYVGNKNEPDLWENGRTVMDAQLGKTFLNGSLDVKLNIKDVFAQKLTFYQDRNQNRKFDSAKDDKIWVSNNGRVFSLSLSYKF